MTDALWKIYSENVPDFLREAASAPCMQRLKDIGMNCGCEYTSFLRFAELEKYSRFDHSFGVALIVWNFTRNKAQTLAGLLHDVSSPVFAHVIDFLRGDHMTQEATEDGTAEIIANDDELQKTLGANGLCTEAVSDYHRYPVADNDSPRLSADRLEYSLGNMLNYGIRDISEVSEYYRDLTLTENENGEPEISFSHLKAAVGFSQAALECARIYVSDEDRYAMQSLAELVGQAMTGGVLCEADLHKTEPELIAKLRADTDFSGRWESFRAMKKTEVSEHDQGGDWRRIFAKKRCIDPLVAGLGRVSDLDADFGKQLEDFRNQSQDYWVRGY